MTFMRGSMRSRGNAGEQCVADWYMQLGYSIILRNYTVRGGEIDLIVHTMGSLVFVEVKVVDGLVDFTNIITRHKRRSLKRTIFHYLSHHDLHVSWRVDVVLVAANRVVHHYPCITL